MTDYTLWHGDCLEEMDRIEDGSIDLILCDPPYGTTACSFDVRIPFEPLWKQYKRVIKKNGAIVLFGSQPFTTLLIASSPYFGTKKQWFKYEWIWDKEYGTNFQLANYQPLKSHENILVFSQGSSTFSKGGIMNYYPLMEKRDKPFSTLSWKQERVGKTENSNLWSRQVTKRIYDEKYPRSILSFNASVAECNHTKRLAPTQKPVALLSYLVKTYTNEGETVLDSTFGSCSTGEAAIRLGRCFIGIERDAGYFRIGQERMERVAAELRGELTHLPMFAEVAASPRGI